MKRNWKYYLGIGLIAFNVLSYIAVALLPFLGLTGGTIASFTAGLIIAAEIAFLGAIALLGKEFLEKIKAKVRGWFARPAFPPKPVSRRRHRVGVAMLLVSFLPYFAAEALLLLGWARAHHTAWIVALLLSSDLLFIADLVILGGEFWERLKKLFEWPGDRGATRTSS